MTGGGDPEDVNTGKVAQDYSALVGSYEQELPGLFDTAKQFLPQYSQLYQSQVSASAPGALKTIQDASPERTALLKKLLTAGSEGPLNYGDALPPDLLRLTNQYSRAGQAARGLGYGPADVYGETGDAAKLSADLVDRNRQFSMNAANTSYQTETDPFLRLLGGILGAGNNQLLSPANSFSLLGDIYNQRNQSKIAGANNTTSAMNNSSQGFDSMAGVLMGCWAAREIFGENDPRWLQFRNWMLHQASERFRGFYLRRGEQWAARLKQATTETRAAVQRWMERRIHHG